MLRDRRGHRRRTTRDPRTEASAACSRKGAAARARTRTPAARFRPPWRWSPRDRRRAERTTPRRRRSRPRPRAAWKARRAAASPARARAGARRRAGRRRSYSPNRRARTRRPTTDTAPTSGRSSPSCASQPLDVLRPNVRVVEIERQRTARRRVDQREHEQRYDEEQRDDLRDAPNDEGSKRRLIVRRSLTPFRRGLRANLPLVHVPERAGVGGIALEVPQRRRARRRSWTCCRAKISGDQLRDAALRLLEQDAALRLVDRAVRLVEELRELGVLQQ